MRTKVLTLVVFLIVWFVIAAVLSLLPLWVSFAVLALLVIDFVFGRDKR